MEEAEIKKIQSELAGKAMTLGASKRGAIFHGDELFALYYFKENNEEVLRFNMIIRKNDKNYEGEEKFGIIWSNREMSNLTKITGLIG